ncbi:MAG TPA: OB-fold domain-containing protein [Acidimicrobiales bacterium]|nr:OB-fold domain-containing protein [Acidimicrobiales bacterium]
MARLEPKSSEVSEPFWHATREQRYLVQWCGACTTPIFYPREVCPNCLSPDSLEWRESSGRGTVYAVSVQYRSMTMLDRVPYAVVLVEVDAGDGTNTIRVMSNVVNCEPTTINVGDAVSLTWEELSDGRNLPLFEPVGG